jgi:hypothetical protein
MKKLMPAFANDGLHRQSIVAGIVGLLVGSVLGGLQIL